MLEPWMITHMIFSFIWMSAYVFASPILFGLNEYGRINLNSKKKCFAFLGTGIGVMILLMPIAMWLEGS